jgi:hypothetical protein
MLPIAFGRLVTDSKSIRVESWLTALRLEMGSAAARPATPCRVTNTHRLSLFMSALLFRSGIPAARSLWDGNHGNWRCWCPRKAQPLPAWRNRIVPISWVSRSEVRWRRDKSPSPCRQRSRVLAGEASGTTETETCATWVCPRCGAAMIVGPILSALHLATVTWSFDSS